MTHVLFWDIDGTLLTTARAGVFALEEAAREVCGAGARPTTGWTATSRPARSAKTVTTALPSRGER